VHSGTPITERVLERTCLCKECNQHSDSMKVASDTESGFLPALLSQLFGFPSLRSQQIPVPSIVVSGNSLLFNPLLPFERALSIKSPINEILLTAKNALADLFAYNQLHFSETSSVLHSRLFERGGQLNDRFSLVICPAGYHFSGDFKLTDPERIRIDESSILYNFKANSGWRFYQFHEEIKVVETCEVCKTSSDYQVDQHGWMPLSFNRVFYITSDDRIPFPVLRYTGAQFQFFGRLMSGNLDYLEFASGSGHSDQTGGECCLFNIHLTEEEIRMEWLVEILRNHASWKKLKTIRLMALNSADKEINFSASEERIAGFLASLLETQDKNYHKLFFR